MTRYYFGDPGLGVSVPTSIHNSATEIKGGVSCVWHIILIAIKPKWLISNLETGRSKSTATALPADSTAAYKQRSVSFRTFLSLTDHYTFTSSLVTNTPNRVPAGQRTTEPQPPRSAGLSLPLLPPARASRQRITLVTKVREEPFFSRLPSHSGSRYS